MQILNTFLKKQSQVSKGCRSVSLQFALSCSKAQVVVLSITCFAMSELDLFGKWEVKKNFYVDIPQNL